MERGVPRDGVAQELCQVKGHASLRSSNVVAEKLTKGELAEVAARHVKRIDAPLEGQLNVQAEGWFTPVQPSYALD